MAIIETCSRGGGNAILLEMKVHELAGEFGDQIEFRTKLVEAWAPPELVIVIIGAVAGAVAARLIDKLFEKRENTKNVTIQIVHQDCRTVFNLPADSQKFIEHLGQLDEKTDTGPSAPG